jgi:hypothetical protein
MLGAGWFTVLAGLGLALVSFAPAALFELNRLAVPGAAAPDTSNAVYAGICGGLTAGLGVAIVAAAKSLNLAVVRAVMQATLVWYVIDSGASIGHGSWQNALSNTVFLAVILPPMLRVLYGGSAEYAAPIHDAVR